MVMQLSYMFIKFQSSLDKVSGEIRSLLYWFSNADL